MQPQPTSVMIVTDIYRRHLLAEAKRLRPKLSGRLNHAARPGLPPAEGREKRMLAALCAASFLAALNFLAPTPFYPQIARDLETTIPLLGQAVTLMILISASLGLAVGPLADRYGYRWPLVGGMLAIAVNLLGTALAPTYTTLLALSVVGGLADAIVFGLPLAIVGARFTGAARQRAIGWVFGSLSSGAILGVPVLTTIGGILGWRVALGIGGFVTLGVGWFVAISLPPDGRRPADRLRPRALLDAYVPLLHHAATLRIYGASALRAAWWFGLLTYLGAFLGDALDLGTAQIGLVYTLGGGGYAAGSLVASGRLGRGSPRTTLAVANVIGGLTVGLLLIVAGIWTGLVLLVACACAAAVGGVGVATLLAANSPAGAGTTMVLNGSVLNFGGAGGAAFGGALIAVGGYEALGVGLLGFAFAGMVLAWWPARLQERLGLPGLGDHPVLDQHRNRTF